MIYALLNSSGYLYDSFNRVASIGKQTDVLNILYIINEAFAERAEIVFSPKYAMMISHDDGKFDSAMNHSRDTLIMLNSFVELSRDYYTEEEINQIKLCQSME